MAVITAPDIPGISGWKPLARGGFATVWQARQDSLGRQVAVKVDFRPLDDDKQRRRFLRESGAAGRLSGHPGIVTVHDAASHALAWLGSVFGQRTLPVGVDQFGQSGAIVDLYDAFDLLPTQITNAALTALTL